MTTPLNVILGIPPDCRPAALRRFLALLRREGDPRWTRAANEMAAAVAFVLREEAARGLRKDARAALQAMANAARNLTEMTGRHDVIEALGVLARPAPGEPDDIAGFEYLVALARRADQAAARIPQTGGGAKTLAGTLGRPSSRMLTAAIVRASIGEAIGNAPSERNATAQAACAALWAAAGGRRAGPTAWVRHLREAGGKAGPASDNARRAAQELLRRLQQDRG